MVQRNSTFGKLTTVPERISAPEAPAVSEPVKAAETSTPSEPQGYVQQSRLGKKAVKVFLPEDAHKALKLLAVQRDLTMEQIVIDALDAYLLDIGADFSVRD